MIKFLRISSVYPGFLKIISKSVNKEDTYDELLKKIFNEKYSVSNYLSLELNKFKLLSKLTKKTIVVLGGISNKN